MAEGRNSAVPFLGRTGIPPRFREKREGGKEKGEIRWSHASFYKFVYGSAEELVERRWRLRSEKLVIFDE